MILVEVCLVSPIAASRINVRNAKYPHPAERFIVTTAILLLPHNCRAVTGKQGCSWEGYLLQKMSRMPHLPAWLFAFSKVMGIETAN